MTRLLMFLVVVAVGGYFFPQVYESTGSPCQALEKKALRLRTDAASANSLIGALTLTLTDGSLGQRLARQRNGNLPAPLDCVVTYYRFPAEWRGN